MKATSLEFIYRNWRGDLALRRVIPIKVHFGATEWHPEPQWLLLAHDLDKGADRDFAMKDMSVSDALPVEDDEAEVSDAHQMSVAFVDIIAERRAQVSMGYTPEHDDEHDRGDLIINPTWGAIERLRRTNRVMHPTQRRQKLVESAALIIAEIERVDRRAAKRAEASA